MSDTTTPGIHPALQAAHDQASAQYAATGKAMGRMDKIRTGLGALTKMGSAVTPEDVIEGAGKLVAGGESPMEVASLLADMPQGGEALTAWLAEHTATTAAKEAQIKSVHEAARHQLGVSSIHALAAHSLNPQ